MNYRKELENIAAGVFTEVHIMEMWFLLINF